MGWVGFWWTGAIFGFDFAKPSVNRRARQFLLVFDLLGFRLHFREGDRVCLRARLFWFFLSVILGWGQAECLAHPYAKHSACTLAPLAANKASARGCITRSHTFLVCLLGVAPVGVNLFMPLRLQKMLFQEIKISRVFAPLKIFQTNVATFRFPSFKILSETLCAPVFLFI